MSRPIIRVNNFLQNNFKNEVYIDTLSKIFIICELPLGVNRLPLLRHVNIIYLVISFIYSVAIVCFSIYSINVFESSHFLHTSTVVMSTIQIMFYAFFDLISGKRLMCYYSELNDFDNQVGCRPKIGNSGRRNIVQMVLNIMYIVAIFCNHFIVPSVSTFDLRLMPAVLVHVIELHYVGHLLNLLVLRLRVMRLSFSRNGNEISARNYSYSRCKMENLMNLYHTLVKAFGYLIDAIKWQFLITLIASFIHILYDCYHVAHSVIRGDGHILMMLILLGKSIGIMLPIFSPCALSDQIHNEVKLLRELLTSSLYENRFNKCSRGVARALLAWTETRDLSFSLLRMLDIDISLPFKFVGLLVTYLIILLQFEKVINL